MREEEAMCCTFLFTSPTAPSMCSLGCHGSDYNEYGISGLTPLRLERIQLSGRIFGLWHACRLLFLVPGLVHSSTLTIDVMCPSDVSNSVRTTQHYFPEGRTIKKTFSKFGQVFQKYEYVYRRPRIPFCVTVTVYFHGARLYVKSY
jgi:hypothetical protein